MRNQDVELSELFSRGQALHAKYRECSSASETPILYEAIELYEQALTLCSRQHTPIVWAQLNNHIGMAYADLPAKAQGTNLRLSIKHYAQALEVLTQQGFSAEWARIKTNIGYAYASLPTADRVDNLRRAISCYQEALRVRTEQNAPLEWARTENNLAAAYVALPDESKTENLEYAIECYQRVCKVFTEETYPADWAMVQNNLGSAYLSLSKGDRNAHVHQAIDHYQRALRVYAEEQFPVDWAMIHNNLGVCYFEMRTGDREMNLQLAINHYRRAMRVYTNNEFGIEWARTQHNLGDAFFSLQGGDRDDNLRDAIEHYIQALEIRTELAFPVDWAKTQNGLGSAYASLTTEVGEGNLERAIECYEGALRVRTERDFPIDWAGTQNNLGIVYARLRKGNRGRNLQQAIACYKAALRVCTPAQLPFDCQQTLRNLGDLFVDQDDWLNALDTYSKAVAVTEQIRAAALDDAGRKRAFHESWVIFDRAVRSAVHCQNYMLALTLTGRGKTRNLADRLWQSEVKPRGVSNQDWRMYQDYLAQARELERGLSSSAGDEANLRERGAVVSGATTLEQLSEMRRSVSGLEARFASGDPDYVPFAQPLEMKEILGLTQRCGAVIVEFRVTTEGTFVFLVGSGEEDVCSEQVVKIAELTAETLSQEVVEWLTAQSDRRRDWNDYLGQATRRLYEKVMKPVRERLRKRYPGTKRLVLVPNQGLNLLPLHAAWWDREDGCRGYLLDDYEITYVPSCLVLDRCLAREQQHAGPAESLLAVQNPDGSLPFADWEVQAVAEHFPEGHRRVLEGAQATEAAVKAAIHYGEEKLFSTHGWFDVRDVDESHLVLHKGKLSLPEIVPLDLHGTWLLVMSACRTSLTDVKDVMDEYQGLPAAFLVAGAQTVVGSLWSVGDVATALLMQRFHSNLYESKMAKASALREAQLWLRDLSRVELDQLLERKRLELSGGQRMATVDVVKALFKVQELPARPFANPHWWAAFQCVGTGWNLPNSDSSQAG